MKYIENFERQEEFDHYQSMDNPFIIITVPLKITNLVKYSQKHGNFYCLFGYAIMNSVNELPAFRYRYVDNKIYLCDRVGISYTEFVNKKVVFFSCFNENKEEFITEFINNQHQVRQLGKTIAPETNDVIWVSCLPWTNYTALIPPFSKNITIPQFIWDKYEKKGDDYYCHLMILIHHGFADGYQVNEFIQKLEENINKFK